MSRRKVDASKITSNGETNDVWSERADYSLSKTAAQQRRLVTTDRDPEISRSSFKKIDFINKIRPKIIKMGPNRKVQALNY